MMMMVRLDLMGLFVVSPSVSFIDCSLVDGVEVVQPALHTKVGIARF